MIEKTTLNATSWYSFPNLKKNGLPFQNFVQNNFISASKTLLNCISRNKTLLVIPFICAIAFLVFKIAKNYSSAPKNPEPPKKIEIKKITEPPTSNVATNSLDWEKAKKAFDERKPPDVECIVGGKTFHLHKEILADASGFLKTNYSPRWNSCIELTFPDAENQIAQFEKICEWMYTGHLSSESIDWDLFRVAYYLNIETLEQKCLDTICRQFTKDNIRDTLLLCDQDFRLKPVKNQIFAFIVLTFSDEELNSILEWLRDTNATLFNELSTFSIFPETVVEDREMMVQKMHDVLQKIKKFRTFTDEEKTMFKSNYFGDYLLFEESDKLSKAFLEFNEYFFGVLEVLAKKLNYQPLFDIYPLRNALLKNQVNLRNLFPISRNLGHVTCIGAEETFNDLKNFLIQKQQEVLEKYPYAFLTLLNPSIINWEDHPNKARGFEPVYHGLRDFHSTYKKELLILDNAFRKKREAQEHFPLWNTLENKPQKGGDLKICIGENIFETHSLLLSKITLVGQEEKTIDFPAPLFEKLLEFLYTKNIKDLSSLPLDEIYLLLKQGRKVLLDSDLYNSLRKCCEEALCTKFPKEFDLQAIVEKYDLEDIYKQTIKNPSNPSTEKLNDFFEKGRNRVTEFQNVYKKYVSNCEFQKNIDLITSMAQEFRLSKLQSICLNREIKQLVKNKEMNSQKLQELLELFPDIEEINLTNTASLSMKDLQFLAYKVPTLRSLNLRLCPWVSQEVVKELSKFQTLEELDLSFTPVTAHRTTTGIIHLSQNFSLPSIKHLILGTSPYDKNIKSMDYTNSDWVKKTKDEGNKTTEAIFQLFPNICSLRYYIPHDLDLFEEAIYEKLVSSKPIPFTKLHLLIDQSRAYGGGSTTRPDTFIRDKDQFLETFPDFQFSYDYASRRKEGLPVTKR